MLIRHADAIFHFATFRCCFSPTLIDAAAAMLSFRLCFSIRFFAADAITLPIFAAEFRCLSFIMPLFSRFFSLFIVAICCFAMLSPFRYAFRHTAHAAPPPPLLRCWRCSYADAADACCCHATLMLLLLRCCFIIFATYCCHYACCFLAALMRHMFSPTYAIFRLFAAITRFVSLIR